MLLSSLSTYFMKDLSQITVTRWHHVIKCGIGRLATMIGPQILRYTFTFDLDVSLPVNVTVLQFFFLFLSFDA